MASHYRPCMACAWQQRKKSVSVVGELEEFRVLAESALSQKDPDNVWLGRCKPPAVPCYALVCRLTYPEPTFTAVVLAAESCRPGHY